MSGAVVVIGVTGCGKSTLGAALAAALGWTFVEGDALHPPENIAKMKAGEPLDDADREPFISNLSRELARHRGAGGVASCSALKRRYRDAIRRQAGAVQFVLPVATREQIAARLARRKEHFMPPGLLDSQLAAFDEPEADEKVIAVDGTQPTGEQVRRVLEALERLGVVSARDRQQHQQQQ